MSAKIKARIRMLNWADTKLYHHFKNKFNLELEKFGKRRMCEEASKLNFITQKLYNYCVEEHVSNKSVILQYINKRVDNETCKFLTMKEMDFTKYLRLRQLKVKHNTTKDNASFSRLTAFSCIFYVKN